MADAPKIDRLVGSGNYSSWKLQVKCILKYKNVWKIVAGEETLANGASEELREAFETRKNKAFYTIVLSIHPSLLWIISPDEEDPVVVWKKLKDMYQKDTFANKRELRKKLCTARLAEGGSANDHIKCLTQIFDELAVFDAPVEEDDKVTYLLSSLPDSYDVLVTALDAMDAVPTWTTVVEKVSALDKKKSKKKDEKALMSRSEESRSEGRRCFKCNEAGHLQRDCTQRERRCFECNGMGHIRRDCPTLKKSSGKTGGKSSEKSGGKSRGKSGWKNGHGKQKECNAEAEKSDDEGQVSLFAQHALSAVGKGGWIIDSGASAHMCNNKTLFTKIDSTKTSSVTVGDGRGLRCAGVGEVMLCLEVPGGKTQRTAVRDVLYVPGLAFNLFSVPMANQKGCAVVFENGKSEVMREGRVMATGSRSGSLYYLDCKSTPEAHVTTGEKESKEDLWHQRYGHLSETSLKKLVNEGMVDGLDYNASKKLTFCSDCADGKNHRQKFDKDGHRRTEALELVHSDVCGKMSVASNGGAYYFLTFIDDATRYTWVYILKTKAAVYEKFREWKAEVEKSFGKELKTLRTDNGGEYTSREFASYLKEEGIRHETTVPKTPEQNGVAERMNRSIVEMARSMLGSMPRRFWAEAVSTAVHLRNRSPTSAVAGKTPYEALHGRKPDVRNLKPFGCVSYAHIPKDERKKLDPKSRKCWLVGYGDSVKAYRLYDLGRSRVIFSRDVIFNEKEFGDKNVERDKEEEDQPDGVVEPDEIEELVEAEELAEEEEPVLAEDEVPVEARRPLEEDPDDQPRAGRPMRQRRPPDRYGEWAMITDGCDPKTYEEAMTTDKAKWRDAMMMEMQSLKKNDVWNLVKLPKDRKVIGSKWVYKTKVTPEGEVDRYKARLVAQGFSQKYGTDYDETFCPVVRA